MKSLAFIFGNHFSTSSFSLFRILPALNSSIYWGSFGCQLSTNFSSFARALSLDGENYKVCRILEFWVEMSFRAPLLFENSYFMSLWYCGMAIGVVAVLFDQLGSNSASDCRFGIIVNGRFIHFGKNKTYAQKSWQIFSPFRDVSPKASKGSCHLVMGVEGGIRGNLSLWTALSRKDYVVSDTPRGTFVNERGTSFSSLSWLLLAREMIRMRVHILNSETLMLYSLSYCLSDTWFGPSLD